MAWATNVFAQDAGFTDAYIDLMNAKAGVPDAITETLNSAAFLNPVRT